MSTEMYPLQLQPVAASILSNLTLSEQRALLGVCAAWDREIQFNLECGSPVHLNSDTIEKYLVNQSRRNHLHSNFVVVLTSVPAYAPGFPFEVFLNTCGEQIRELSLGGGSQHPEVDAHGHDVSSGAHFLFKSLLVDGRVPNLRALDMEVVLFPKGVTRLQCPTGAPNCSLKKLRRLTIRGVSESTLYLTEFRHSSASMNHTLMPVVCPEGLQSLHLRDTCGFSLYNVMQLPVPPALRSVSVSGAECWGSYFSGADMPSFGAAFPLLEELEILLSVTDCKLCIGPEEFPNLKRMCLTFHGTLSSISFRPMDTLHSLSLIRISASVQFLANAAGQRTWQSLEELHVVMARRSSRYAMWNLGWTDSESYRHFPRIKVLNLEPGLLLPALPALDIENIMKFMPDLEELRVLIDATVEPVLTGLSPEICKMISEKIGCFPALNGTTLQALARSRKDYTSISSLARLRTLELHSTDPDFGMSAGILFEITECAGIEHLSLQNFNLTGRSGIIFKAIATKMKRLRRLDMRVVSTTKETERRLHLAVDEVNITFYPYLRFEPVKGSRRRKKLFGVLPLPFTKSEVVFSCHVPSDEEDNATIRRLIARQNAPTFRPTWRDRLSFQMNQACLRD